MMAFKSALFLLSIGIFHNSEQVFLPDSVFVSTHGMLHYQKEASHSVRLVVLVLVVLVLLFSALSYTVSLCECRHAIACDCSNI